MYNNDLTSVTTKLTNFIIRIEVVTNVTISANSYKAVEFQIPSGYSNYSALIAIYRNNSASNSLFAVDTSTIYFTSENKFTLTVRSFENSALNTQCRAFVILVKS